MPALQYSTASNAPITMNYSWSELAEALGFGRLNFSSAMAEPSQEAKAATDRLRRRPSAEAVEHAFQDETEESLQRVTLGETDASRAEWLRNLLRSLVEAIKNLVRRIAAMFGLKIAKEDDDGVQLSGSPASHERLKATLERFAERFKAQLTPIDELLKDPAQHTPEALEQVSEKLKTLKQDLRKEFGGIEEAFARHANRLRGMFGVSLPGPAQVLKLLDDKSIPESQAAAIREVTQRFVTYSGLKETLDAHQQALDKIRDWVSSTQRTTQHVRSAEAANSAFAELAAKAAVVQEGTEECDGDQTAASEDAGGGGNMFANRPRSVG